MRGSPSVPWSTVTVAVIGRAERLATWMVSSSAPPAAEVPAAQYQAVETASAGGTTGPSTPTGVTRGAATSDG